jgi:hypothetical protein
MATRSTIAVIHQDGSVSQVYCHWDGYLEHNGKFLIENYATQELAESLVALGDLSSLSKTVGVAHPFGHYGTDLSQDEYYKLYGNMNTYYGRDRGETGTEVKRYSDVYEYLDKFQDEGYNYLFNGTSWGYQAYNMTEYVEVTADMVKEAA